MCDDYHIFNANSMFFVYSTKTNGFVVMVGLRFFGSISVIHSTEMVLDSYGFRIFYSELYNDTTDYYDSAIVVTNSLYNDARLITR